MNSFISGGLGFPRARYDKRVMTVGRGWYCPFLHAYVRPYIIKVLEGGEHNVWWSVMRKRCVTQPEIQLSNNQHNPQSNLGNLLRAVVA